MTFLEDQVITSCVRLLKGGLHKQKPMAAFLSHYLIEGQNCLVSTSSTSTHIFEGGCHSANDFLQQMQRRPCEREAPLVQYTIQGPGDLLVLPHLPALSVLVLDAVRQKSWLDETPQLQLQISKNMQISVEYIIGVWRSKFFLNKSFIRFPGMRFFSCNRPLKKYETVRKKTQKSLGFGNVLSWFIKHVIYRRACQY